MSDDDISHGIVTSALGLLTATFHGSGRLSCFSEANCRLVMYDRYGWRVSGVERMTVGQGWTEEPG